MNKYFSIKLFFNLNYQVIWHFDQFKYKLTLKVV